MSILNKNLDEVLHGLSDMHIATLQQAAAISPYINERTLGPDLEPWDEKNLLKYAQNLKNDNKENENKSPPKKSTPTNKILPTKAKTPESKPVHNSQSSDSTSSDLPLEMPVVLLSPQALVASIQKRELEKSLNKTIRDELIEKHQRHLEDTKNASILEHSNFQEERRKRLEKLRERQRKINEEAEKQAQKELEQQKRELNELQRQTQQQLKMIAFQGISKYQTKFRTKYEAIAKLLISIDKEAILACGDFNRRLKEMIQTFEDLINKMKLGNFGVAELKIAEKLCNSLDELEANILSELENIVKQEQERVAEQKVAEDTNKLQEQLELQKQQQQQQQQAEVEAEEQQLRNEAAATLTNLQAKESSSTTTLSSTEQQSSDAGSQVTGQVSPQREKFYRDLMQLYEHKIASVKTFQENEELKKYRNACQRTVNTPINAISNVSGEFLLDKYTKICNFFAGQPQVTNFGHITINDHPLARDYCLLLMAKTFVGKGYLEISSKNSQIAFAIATVLVALWKAIPEFGEMYLAHTFKQSPLLAPIYLPKQPEQSYEDYCVVMGYHYDKNGKLEEQEVYLKRQAGIARLYACVMITNGRQADGLTHPYGLEQAWYWLVNFLLIEPMPNISAIVMLEILEIIGADMWLKYSKQFIKLLVYVQFNYMPRLNAVDQGGPKVRLEMLLDKYLREGLMTKPNGILPPGFW